MASDDMKKANEKVVRMDDFFLDELFSTPDQDLLQEASEDGIDVAAVGNEGREAFESAQLVVGRNRLFVVRQEMAKDQKKSPNSIDRARAQSEVNAILARNREAQSKLTMAARNESGDQDDDMDSIIEDFAELGAIGRGDKDQDA